MEALKTVALSAVTSIKCILNNMVCYQYQYSEGTVVALNEVGFSNFSDQRRWKISRRSLHSTALLLPSNAF